jgi:hypothetical protein
MTKRYTDREVSLILQRALEPTAEATSPDVPGHGLTLEQIKEIAAEVGIDPGRIDLAAASLLEPAPVPANPYAGIPTTVQFQTTLPGIDLANLSQHDVLALIRGTLGRQGIVGSESGSVEWRARDAFGGRYVSLTPTPNGVRVRVLGNYRDALLNFVAVIGVLCFAGISVALSGAEVGSTLSLLGGAVSSLIPPRFAYRWWRKREDATMAALHTKLVALLQASAPSGTPDSLKRSVREVSDEQLLP